MGLCTCVYLRQIIFALLKEHNDLMSTAGEKIYYFTFSINNSGCESFKQAILIATAVTFAAIANGVRRKEGTPVRKLPELLYDCQDIGGGQERCKVDECRAWFGTVKRGCLVR